MYLFYFKDLFKAGALSLLYFHLATSSLHLLYASGSGLGIPCFSAIPFLDQSNFVFKNGIGSEIVLFLLRELKTNNPSSNLNGTLQLSHAECQDFEILTHFRKKDSKMSNSHGMRKAFGYLFLKNT